ncbi:helix-turn-helix domain-containing protein [Cohnella nanjingensis]|uniref:Helix-turn-helix domain-containing protein n=1 Tax=Cohnella nanjingensis TaxID=1387779 RepID=A0A7X0VFJ0_9BACL|nr:helix-turn-helix domain-containing protein [Cohnella nanjingensis]MBB6672082.1 helix-turn-helix domain-containing protein [Cohnella nanjingensis]
MAKKNEYSAGAKLRILRELESGEGTRMEVARKHNISVQTLVTWRHRYERYGMNGLEIQARNRRYSADLKMKAVEDYLSGQYSQYELIDKYQMASRTPTQTRKTSTIDITAIKRLTREQTL